MLRSAAIAIAILFASQVHGGRLIVFGDSLSDGGYFWGVRQVNPGGLLWHEYLADKLVLDRAETGFFGRSGYNFAVSANLASNLPAQVNRFEDRNYTWQSDDLCTLWIGGNDVRGNPNQDMTLVTDIVGDIITQLNGFGIDRFIIANLPDIGAIPEEPDAPFTRAQRTAGTINYNNALATELNTLESSLSITILRLDVYTLFNEMLLEYPDYGFTNVTDPMDGLEGIVADEYAFWDDIHPTTRGHYLISAAALALVDPSTPIEIISWSIQNDGTLRQTWIGSPEASYEIRSGSQVDALNITNSYQGSPAYTEEVAPPSPNSGFFKTERIDP